MGRTVALFELFLEVDSGKGILFLSQLFGRSAKDELSACGSAIRTHVDNVVGHLDDIHIVFDNKHGIALVDQLLQHAEEDADVFEMETCGGLVEDIEGVARVGLGELGGKLDTLGLAAAEGGALLAKGNIAETYVLNGAEFAEYLGIGLEEVYSLVDGHIEHVGNRLTLVADLEGLAVVAFSVADLAVDIDIGEEIHLYRTHACSLAGVATASGHIEGETAGLVATHTGAGQLGKEIADVVEYADIGGRIGTRGASDGRLVDLDYLVDILDAGDALVGQRTLLGMIEMGVEDGMEGLVDEGALSATAHACNADEESQRNVERYALEVVACCTCENEMLAVLGTSADGYLNIARSVKVVAGGSAMLEEFVEWTFCHNLSAMNTCSRSNIYDIVCSQNHIAVVFDHNNAIAQVAKLFESVYQLAVVALVKAYGRLVEDIKHVDQLGSYLGGQTDALAFASGEGLAATVEREIANTYVEHELGSGGNLAYDFVSHFLTLGIEFGLEVLNPVVELDKVHGGYLSNILAVDEETERLVLES